jgi:hypothetical protein
MSPVARTGRLIGKPCLALQRNFAEVLLKKVVKSLRTSVVLQKKKQEGGSLMPLVD